MKSAGDGWEPGSSFVLPSVKWVEVDPPPWVAGRSKRGSVRRALCRSPTTFLELAGTPWTRRGGAHGGGGETVQPGRADRRDLSGGSACRPKSSQSGNLTLGPDLRGRALPPAVKRSVG